MSLKYPKQPSSQKTSPQFVLTKKIPVTLIRQQSGAYVDGYWVDAEASRTTIHVNIQPMRGYELMQMPEAERTREWVKFYTTDDVSGLQDARVSGARNPDMILYNNKQYEIAKVSTYEMGILDHTKVVAALVEG